jgi:hypothetical protein
MDDDDLQSSVIQDPSDDMKAINAMQIRVFSIFIEPFSNSEFPSTDLENETFIQI